MQRYNNYFNYANMSHKYLLIQITSGVLIPVLASFLNDALVLMIPWFIAMITVIMADLFAGLWKAYRLEIPIRFSKACRDTMGKTIVYFAFIMMACCINVADNGDFNWAKWLAILIVVIEVGSIIGNILKPHGINISLNAIIKAALTRSPIPLTCEEADAVITEESIEKIRQEELEKQGIKQQKQKKNGKNN